MNVQTVIRIFRVIKRSLAFVMKEPKVLFSASLMKKYLLKFKSDSLGENETYSPFEPKEYQQWICHVEQLSSSSELDDQPFFSILLVSHEVEKQLLTEMIASLLTQTYTNFEVFIIGEPSETDRSLFEKVIQNNGQFHYITWKNDLATTLNEAVSLCYGEFIGMIEYPDLLRSEALFEIANTLNESKEIDLLYTDYDHFGSNGRENPVFKPDWSPDTFLGQNYLKYFTLIRKQMIEEVGGFHHTCAGAIDFDLFLQITEKTKKIKHLAKILYHKRLSKSADHDMKLAGQQALERALTRRKTPAQINIIENASEDVPYYLVEYTYQVEPMVSIIIPMRDQHIVTKKCLQSIFEKTNYGNFEVILIDNGSVEPASFALFQEFQERYPHFKLCKIDCEFNYSYLNNIAAKEASGEFLVLLNNDTEVISADWLAKMVGYAMQDHIGAVGVKLLYPDDTIQHGGVVAGLYQHVAAHTYQYTDRQNTGIYAGLQIPRNYSAVTAACLMVSKKKYWQVGGLEEKLHVTYNDVDFNLKLLEAGYYNVFLPNVELYHHESKSRGFDTNSKKYKLFLKESNFMYKKWGSLLENDPFYNPNFSKKAAFGLDKTKE